MTNAPAPIERRGDRRRRGAGEWGCPPLDKCGIEDSDAFANGCARDRWVVGASSTQWTPASVQLAITTQEQTGALRSPIVSAGARSEHELQQCEAANATGRRPVAFVHGLWLLPSSWDRWAALFEENGFVALTPGWPDDPDTVEEAKAHPEVFAGKSIGQVADHFEKIIKGLQRKPAIVGHSFGGLLTQIVAGLGLAAASVAIDPAAFRGVLPLPISSLKSAFPVLGNPVNRNRAVPLTMSSSATPSPTPSARTRPRNCTRLIGADLGEAAVPGRDGEPQPVDRGQSGHRESSAWPLLIISGEKDNTVPWAIAHASYKQQEDNKGVTEVIEIKNRGHALTIDSGWREVADTALAFVTRFTQPTG